MSGRSNHNVGSFVTSLFNMSPQNQMPPQSFDVGGSSNYAAPSRMETYCGGDGEGSDVVRSLPPPTLDDKPMIVELASVAMEELVALANQGPPIWIPGYSLEILNVNEYMKAFPMGIGPKPLGFRTEASRESVVVIMNHINLVEILMDVVSILVIILKIIYISMCIYIYI